MLSFFTGTCFFIIGIAAVLNTCHLRIEKLANLRGLERIA